MQSIFSRSFFFFSLDYITIITKCLLTIGAIHTKQYVPICDTCISVLQFPADFSTQHLLQFLVHLTGHRESPFYTLSQTHAVARLLEAVREKLYRSRNDFSVAPVEEQSSFFDKIRCTLIQLEFQKLVLFLSIQYRFCFC